MLELLRDFPAIWGMCGVILAAGIFWAGSRKLLVFLSSAQERLTKILQLQITALEKERDDYRKGLHYEREAHQSTILKVKELELRPDMSSVNTLLITQADTLAKICETLTRLPNMLDSLSRAFNKQQEVLIEALSAHIDRTLKDAKKGGRDA